ncbi:hypothetical protein [Caminibacter sp.]
MIEGFLEEYFKDIKKVSEFHFDFLLKNRFKFPKVNYLEVKRFIDTATNFLKDIDPDFLNSLANKLYKDIQALYEFYSKFKKKVEYDEVVFYREYLENLEEYKRLNEKYNNLKKQIEALNSVVSKTEERIKNFEDTKDEDKIKELKKLKKNYVDAIYELSKIKEEYEKVKKELKELEEKEKLKFMPKFKTYKEKYLKLMEKIIATKLYYFDRLLWECAKKSDEIQKFFIRSHIQGDFSTKTFIDYFIKNIDVSIANDGDWIMYLRKISKVIE